MKNKLGQAALLAALLGLAAGCQGAWTLRGAAEPTQGRTESVRSALYPESVRSALYGERPSSDGGLAPQRRHDRDRTWKQAY
ncbi:hypothetical protein ACTHPH_09735 [Paenibacillus pasadenensis]|uniref:Uncharacterized protein n=1 Tax=Paenibacillus pasadenensis TaxID=217090 RepID=A0A2N5N7S1_9BACL|nr:MULTISPECIES: hypothetical protein [Paenibacillus]PLT46397.1 hypothetical protein B8V81_4828 [Paenibacillus pasadenensis]QGG56828.1 hypothetical protein GE073_15355 [Paenibacillus sp. B01]